MYRISQQLFTVQKKHDKNTVAVDSEQVAEEDAFKRIKNNIKTGGQVDQKDMDLMYSEIKNNRTTLREFHSGISTIMTTFLGPFYKCIICCKCKTNSPIARQTMLLDKAEEKLDRFLDVTYMLKTIRKSRYFTTANMTREQRVLSHFQREYHLRDSDVINDTEDSLSDFYESNAEETMHHELGKYPRKAEIRGGMNELLLKGVYTNRRDELLNSRLIMTKEKIQENRDRQKQIQDDENTDKPD